MPGTLDRQSWEVDPSVKSKAITYNPTTVGDQATPIVSAIAGKKIRVFAWAVSISINGAQSYMKDSTGVQKTELLLRTISGSTIPARYTSVGYPGIFLFETAVGASLQMNCAQASATVSANVVYAYV